MFKNLWYVAAPSSHLQDTPLPVRLLGLDLVAFRDESGQAQVLSDICVHRGGALSAGQRVGSTLRCPYHGWAFGTDGRCTLIPAQPESRIPAKARVDAYPTIERYGWIWVFLGDLPPEQRPPLPELPWVNDPALRIVRGHYDWNANWDRVVENGLDFAHAPFVHGSTFGDAEHPEIAPFDVRSDAWSGDALMRLRRPVRSGLSRRRIPGRYIEVATRPGYHLSGPCTTLALAPRGNWRIHIVAAHVPVDANHTRTWWIMGRSFLRSRLFDRQTIARNLRIFEQDHAVLSKVRPERVPDEWQDEVSVKSDALQIAFRRRLRELEASGWRLDDVRIQQEFSGRKACVMPSPERRNTVHWAIAEVPTRPPAAAAASTTSAPVSPA